MKANVWRKQTVRYVVDGKQVVKGTTGAKAVRELSRRLYGTLRLANGKRKQEPLTEDAKSSRMLLRRLQTLADEQGRGKSGIGSRGSDPASDVGTPQ